METLLLKVLLVDNSSTDAALLQDSLARSEPGRFEVTTSRDLNEAASRLREGAYDVMLLDLSVSGQAGDTCLRARMLAPLLPIVVLANLDDDVACLDAMRNGIEDYWLKRQIFGRPLAHAIRCAIERKRLESTLRKNQADLERTIQKRTAELVESNRALRAEMARRQKSEQARKQALRQLGESEETERRRISRELHDRLGQDLTALKLGLRNLQKECPFARQALELEASRLSPANLIAAGWELPKMRQRDLAPRSRRRSTEGTCAFAGGVGRRIKKMEELTDGLMRDVHRLAMELHPAALDDLGLDAALRRYASDWSERSEVVVHYYSDGFGAERLPLEMETTLYRIAQEALTNVVRHANARRVSVILERRPGEALLIVEDDGVGFEADAAASQGKLGLVSMRERVMLLGGSLEVESHPGSGTSVFARVPVEHKITEQCAP